MNLVFWTCAIMKLLTCPLNLLFCILKRIIMWNSTALKFLNGHFNRLTTKLPLTFLILKHNTISKVVKFIQRYNLTYRIVKIGKHCYPDFQRYLNDVAYLNNLNYKNNHYNNLTHFINFSSFFKIKWKLKAIEANFNCILQRFTHCFSKSFLFILIK